MAMGEVMAVLRNQKERKNRLEKTLKDLDVQAQIAENQAVEEERKLKAREESFRIAFPTEQAQLEVISKFSMRFPMLDPKGSVVRNLAMESWWSEQDAKAATSEN